MVNNPCGVGLHEARLLFGAREVQRGTVVSVGTGRALAAHTDYRHMSRALQPAEPQATSWKDKFNKILDSATDTEGGCRLSANCTVFTRRTRRLKMLLLL